MAGVGEREMGRDEMQVAAPEHMDHDKSKQVGQASVGWRGRWAGVVYERQ